MGSRLIRLGWLPWVRRFALGVAAGVVAQGIAAGWHWVREPAAASNGRGQ